MIKTLSVNATTYSRLRQLLRNEIRAIIGNTTKVNIVDGEEPQIRLINLHDPDLVRLSVIRHFYFDLVKFGYSVDQQTYDSIVANLEALKKIPPFTGYGLLQFTYTLLPTGESLDRDTIMTALTEVLDDCEFFNQFKSNHQESKQHNLTLTQINGLRNAE